MKVIDLYLTIEKNKNIPKEVVYKYKTYRYYPEYKQYFREEYGDTISLFLEATMEDKVYLIEDTPKEDKKIEKLDLQYKDITKGIKFEEQILMYCDNLQYKINEIIDRLNGEDNEQSKNDD
jgi:hypothetical protein